MRARGAAGLLPTALVAAALSGCGEGGRDATAMELPPATDLPAIEAQPGGEEADERNAARTGLRPPLAIHVRRRTQLRASPGGRVLATLGTRTEFRSPRILAVVQRRPGWVKVRTERRGRQTGWLPTSSGALFSSPRTIVVDLSKRRLTVFHRGRPAGTYKVAIGAPGSETPTGRFAVTDRLRVKPGSPYGCCILALNGRQPKIPQGWGGGDRIAIHATPSEGSVGQAVSHGCLRATEKTMRRLMRQVRLGTPVRIKA